ncbi:MAG: hypothetical protein ACK47E_01710 [Cyclobacteriaceae bacterium]|jgi:hypothetical protein
MKNQILERFRDFALSEKVLFMIKGGRQQCLCKAAAPYACEAAGYNTSTRQNTSDFNKCMNEVYSDCDALGACNQPVMQS